MTATQVWDFDLNGYLFRGGGGTPARLNEVTGLDHPEADFITHSKSGAHGAFTSAKYTKERTITLAGYIRVDDPATLPAALTDLRYAFRPTLVDIPLSWLLPGLPVQYAKVKPFSVRYSITAEGSAVGYVEFLATLVAGDPLIYSFSNHSVTINPGATSGGMTFPATFPMTFSVGGTSGAAQLQNAGNTAAPTVVHFIGPLTNPVLTDTSTGSYFGMRVDILSGDEIVVDSAARTVLYRPVGQLSGGTTRYSAISSGSHFLEIPGSSAAAESFQASADAGAGSIVVLYSDTWL